MIKKAKSYSGTGFEEDEIKLNAPDKAYLNRVWKSVLRGKHYVRADEVAFMNRPDRLNWDVLDPQKPDAPLSISGRRYRYYFDTPDLDLFNAGIELRIQLEKKGFQQVIKFPISDADPGCIMQRLEYPAQLREFKADLKAIDKKAKFRKEALEILSDTVKGKPLGPKVAIRSQRRKLSYHPGGDRDITIENALDIALAISVLNFQENIRQNEIESKKNDTNRPINDLLMGEASRLVKKFPRLSFSNASKPQACFLDIQKRMKGKKARKLMRELPTDQFQLISDLSAFNMA